MRFQTIMKKRKKYVDTMDDAGRLLGQIAHRDEKVRFKPVNVRVSGQKTRHALSTLQCLIIGVGG